MNLWRVALTVGLSCGLAASPAAGQSGRATYAGRLLTDVLGELQAGGLKIVYSSELVRPDDRVVAEPRARSPRKMLDEMLRPHALETRNGPNGTLLVVTRARTPPAKKAAASAAPGGVVSGHVIDATTAAPIAGVLVEVQTSGHSTRTDEQGAFVLSGVPAGSQSLFVSTIGYALARPSVDVKAGETTDLTVPLAEGTGAYTERVTVTANRLTDPVQTSPVQDTLGSAGLLDVRSVLVDDPLRAVQALPGVAANDDFRSDFSVRGASFGHLGLSIDGVATPWLLHSFEETEDSGSMAILNSDVLDRVTLSRGAYPQRDGDRTGAWLESTMREGSRAATAVRGAVSGTNASLLGEGPLGAGGSWLVSVRRSYIDWLIRRIVPDFSDSLFGFTDVQGKLVYDLTPHQQLQVTAIAARSNLDQQSSDASDIDTAADDVALGTVALRSTLGSSVVLLQRASIVAERFRNLNQAGLESASGHVRELSYRADLNWAPRADTLVDAGIQWHQQNESRDIHVYSESNRTLRLQSHDAFEASGHVPSFFARVTFGPGRGVSIAPGARVAHSTVTGETIVSPWLQTSWAITRSLSLRAGAGLYHQFPELSQVSGLHAGTDLKSERSTQADVALEHHITPSIGWQVSLYHRDDERGLRRAASEYRVVNGKVVVPRFDDPWQNALTGRANGVELLLQRTSAQGLSGWASYSFGRSREQDVLTGEQFDGDFDQRHTLNTWLQYAVSSRTSVSGKLRIGSNFPIPGYWEQRISGVFIGERRNEVRVPTYARLDLRANRVYNYTNRRLTLFVEVMNVLDRDNVRAVIPDSVTLPTRRVSTPLQSLFPLLPSVGFLLEF